MLHKVCNVYCHTEFDKQDLFQEIIVQLWKSFPRFRGESKFGTWLYRIALNTAISDFRRQKKTITSTATAEVQVDIEDFGYSHEKDV